MERISQGVGRGRRGYVKCNWGGWGEERGVRGGEGIERVGVEGSLEGTRIWSGWMGGWGGGGGV